VPAEVVKDPRTAATQADLDAQFDLLIRIRDRVTAANGAVTKIRTVKRDVDGALQRLRAAGDAVPKASADSVRALAKGLTDELTAVEEAIYQTKNRSSQDPLNFPIRLNNKIAALAGVVAQGDNRPTDQAQAVFEELSAALQQQLDRMDAVLKQRIPAFNAAVGGLHLPAVVVNE
jgi:DNA anti-recombination protein RmuC